MSSPPRDSNDRIRQRLDRAPTPHAGAGDHAVAGLPTPPSALTEAAVLVPLVDHPSGLTVLLTRRTQHLAHHAGQISFPGGRSEAHDQDALATALREAQEEIGLLPARVDVAGYLPSYQTVTGFLVTPVVGFLAPPLTLSADPNEVDEVFEVPLEFLLDRNNHRRHHREVDGKRRYYHAMPWGDYYIWGATAAMLVSLVDRLSD